MSLESRAQYLRVQCRRYKTAGKAYKSRLIDEVCAVCGYERKYAIKRLNRSAAVPVKKRGKPPVYSSPEFLKVLAALWMAAGQLCSKRLKTAIPVWLPHYERRHGVVSDECRQQLLEVSPATIDRLLKARKAQCRRKRNCGTKPGSLLNTAIPIRTSNAVVDRPGYLEVDTVAHCGGSMSGSFCWSVTYTDLICEWTMLRAVWNKSAAAVVEQTQDVEQNLPFALLGFDSDNGSEFINQHLTDDLLKRKRPVCFTRSRPYRKNDNAHVEQKNWTHVRELLGYDRLGDPALVTELNTLYADWEKLNNFFKPVMKLASKERVGGRYVKTYDVPATPYERLNASGILTPEKANALKEEYNTLDPFDLNRRIEKQLRRMEELKKQAGKTAA